MLLSYKKYAMTCVCTYWSNHSYSVFSLTWPAFMQIYWNKRKRLHKKRIQLPQDWFGTPTWPPWRHVKTLYWIGHFRVPKNLTFKARLSAKPLIWKWVLIMMQIKLIFRTKVSHLALFWKWNFLELRNGLLFCLNY